jgi:hypothetical protein
VLAVDVLLVDSGIELVSVAGEAAVAEWGENDLTLRGTSIRPSIHPSIHPYTQTNTPVGDVKTSVDGTLEDTEDAGSGGGAGQTDIKEGAEGAGSLSLSCEYV